MYGRCETDPFDQATDVCDSCYGEFCSACMVKTKGRKHPVCKECTIIASGVRPGAKPLLRGSKKTAAKRRRALQQAPVESPSFEYFDDAASSGSNEVSELTLLSEMDSEKASELAGERCGDDGEPAAGTDEPTAIEPAIESTDLIDGIEPIGSDGSGDPIEVIGSPGPGSGPAGEPSVASARSVTPGLAALARRQAERDQPAGHPDDDLASVPAPDWLTTPDDGSSPFADEPVEVEASTDPGDQRTPIDDSAKPVTGGFDWVTEMPARGSSAPLPSRASAGPAAEPIEQPAGGVATAEAPPAALPRRRSTLRAPDDTSR